MTATPLVEPATGISQELVYPQSSASSPLSLTLPSPAIITSQASFSNSGSSGFKRGRLLIRQQRVKKDGEVSGGGDLETPDVYTSSDSYLLSVPSSSIASARIERHASEPSPATFTPSVSSQNLLNVPTQSSSSSYLVKQHSHPLLPSQTSSSSSYTLTRQLSYPTQMTVQSQTIANTSSFSSHAAQEIVAGQLLQLQHHKPPNVRSHTMPHYSTVSEMDVVSEQRQESPTVVIIPDISHESNIEHHQQTHIQSQKQMQQQLPTIRVKSEELQRSISSPMVRMRFDFVQIKKQILFFQITLRHQLEATFHLKQRQDQATALL